MAVLSLDLAKRYTKEALDSQCGAYKWGKQDCLHTATAIMNAHGVEGARYNSWYQWSEKQAVMRVKRKWGGLASAAINYYANGLPEGLKMTFDENDIKWPGEIAFIRGFVVVNSALWDTEERGDLLAFRSPTYELLTWAPMGLTEVTGEYEVFGKLVCEPIRGE